MKNVVICGFARSPFTLAHKGALAKVRADEMAATVVKSLIQQTGVDANYIEDLILGCAFPEGEQGFNLARLITFLADLPRSVAGVTVNRFCGSSMQALHMAAGHIQLGAGEAFICAGVESMTRVPMTGFNPLPNPNLYASYPQAYIGMGETAENLAKKYKISREKQEKFALASQEKCLAATEWPEIVPINGITEDATPRAETSLEGLAGLKPAFSADGSVTAGTSSPLTDGAVALLVTSEEFAKKHDLNIMAHVKSTAVSGCDPEIMGIGPVEASRKALQRARLKLEDMDVIELNEAFAAQALAVIDELGIDEKKLNIDGGAIALGHPLGASGARILGQAAKLLRRTGGRYALATMCIGGGQGIATVLERKDD